MYLRYKSGILSLSFKDKKTGKEDLKPCFKQYIPPFYFTVDHDSYIFFAANTGQNIPNQHLIHNVRFYDVNHLHDSEGQDNQDEKREFHGKAKDVMR